MRAPRPRNMRRGSKLPDMGWTGRQRGRKTVFLVATVCMVLMIICIPHFLQMNVLPDIDSPIDRLESNGVEFSDLGKFSYSSHRRRNQEHSLGASDDRQPEMPSATTDEIILKADSKFTQDSQVSLEAFAL